MATKNIVPRANGEGGIGTSAKRWLNGFFKNVTVDTSLTTVTPGNSDNSTKAATTAFVENTFFDKLVAKLLATTAATITSLSTSSLFYRFLAQALSVAGVQYNLSNSSAWYICLGSLFGGLIIQGGLATIVAATETAIPSGNRGEKDLTAPINYTLMLTAVASNNYYSADGLAYRVSNLGNSTLHFVTMNSTNNAIRPAGCLWIGIFK